MKRARWLSALGLIASIAVSDIALARIKLITLPARERVEIKLESPAGTLVEEERLVPLVRGSNQIDFSWANSQIDPGSLVFQIEAENGAAQVLSVSYPPNENALVWHVSASEAGPARVRISYLLAQLKQTFNYRATADRDERLLDFSQYVRLRNDAPETFGDSGIWLGRDQRIERPIEGQQTREVLVRRWPRIPVEKTYTADLARFGWDDTKKQTLKIAMHYVLRNDRQSGLGERALPYGKARIYQDDGRGGNAFLGEDWGQRTSTGDKMALYLGQSRDVVVKRTVLSNRRERIEGNLHNQHIVLRYRIENFKDEAVALKLREDLRSLASRFGVRAANGAVWELGPETSFPGRPDPELTDAGSVVMTAPLASAPDGGDAAVNFDLHIVFKNNW
ncbi:MAG: hypothetical protein AAF458_00460 [Pseudomonadota bacterium]